MTVRPGRRDEIPAVLALWRAAGSKPGSTDTAEHLGRLLERDPGALLAAGQSGRVVWQAAGSTADERLARFARTLTCASTFTFQCKGW